MLQSNYRELCAVEFPPFMFRQCYMHSFDLAEPWMPLGYDDYLEPVTALCKAANATRGVAHMTIDEKVVTVGMSQRRPGPHVDGCFVVQRYSWVHDPRPAWLHYCNDVPGRAVARMPVIVAASVAGCRAWRGQFDGEPGSDGDLSHIAAQLGEGEVLRPNVGYLLSPDCVHESMLFAWPTKRSFLRIALPVDYPF
jgi:hypothetical protein